MERSELITKLMEASLRKYNEEEGMIYQINENMGAGYMWCSTNLYPDRIKKPPVYVK